MFIFFGKCLKMVTGNETHPPPPAAVEISITPARATFPFKPASTLIALQHLQADAENRPHGDQCHGASTTIESTLQQQEIIFIEIKDDPTEGNDPCLVPDEIRRTAVAIAGGTILSVGLVLIPFPIIPGSLIAYGGLMLLASEFDSAKQALESVNQAISKWRAVSEGGEVNICDRGKILIQAMMLKSEGVDTSKRKCDPENEQSASGQTPVSLTCQSELFGCGPFPSSSLDEHDSLNETTHITHASFRRLGSSGSISLNTLGSSFGDDIDSFWVTFDCNPFRDHTLVKVHNTLI